MKLGGGVSGMYYSAGDDDWMTQNLLATAGLAPIAQDGTIAFATPKGEQAVKLFERFRSEGGRWPSRTATQRQQIVCGKLGMYFNSTAAVRSFERRDRQPLCLGHRADAGDGRWRRRLPRAAWLR